MNKKEKQFIYNLLNKDYLLTACDYNYANDDKKLFKEDHGITFKRAEKIVEKFLQELKEKINK